MQDNDSFVEFMVGNKWSVFADPQSDRAKAIRQLLLTCRGKKELTVKYSNRTTIVYRLSQPYTITITTHSMDLYNEIRRRGGDYLSISVDRGGEAL